MIEKATEEELELLDLIYDPVAMSEILFSNYDKLNEMNEDEFGEIRLCQVPLLSHEFEIDEDPNLTKKQNFLLRKGASEAFCYGGRKYGKSAIFLKVDLLITLFLVDSESIGFTSYDAMHFKRILEDVINALENHPILRYYKGQINRSPTYRICTENGNVCESVNMNLTGKAPGKQFFGKHFHRLFAEENSFETEQVYTQRRDSISELGCIFRFSGMCNFTKNSPPGKIFFDRTKKPWIINLPQKVNKYWDAKDDEEAIKDFGGKSSPLYRCFVDGEVSENSESTFDMERIRDLYDENRRVKVFEIPKKDFNIFKSILILERPKNAEVCFIASDIGESASSEIIVLFKINNKYRYVYNIVLWNLTDKEQYEIFKYIGELLDFDFMGLDCSDGTGRAIFRSLEETFGKERLVWVGFNEKMPIDFERDDKGEIVRKEGKVVYKEEYVIEWSVKRLRDLFYSGKIDMPFDSKFDLQFDSVVSMQSGKRMIYSCLTTSGDHLYQAFQVFAITEWNCEFLSIQPKRKKAHCKGLV